MNSLSAATAILALLSAEAVQAQAVQPSKADQKLNDPVENSRCGGSRDRGLNYPFSVERIKAALDVDWTVPDPVAVIVVDNAFIGYRQNDADSRWALPSRNFPVSFFAKASARTFKPWLADEDAVQPPRVANTSPKDGHATHVAGIVLGGWYDDNQSPEDGAGGNLLRPNVRRLLLFEPELKENLPEVKYNAWIRLRFATVRFGTESKNNPLERLANALVYAPTGPKIVNMSVGYTLTSNISTHGIRLPDALDRDSLLVASAGNSEALLWTNGPLRTVPAMLPEDPRILVVASHDADGTLSPFSNYGEPVMIAAPGCNIMSWINAEDAAVPLSGTSMAAGVVSFAAALVRSRWPEASGIGLKNRLLASARYDPNLEKCPRAVDPQLVSAAEFYCVRHGSKLDIPAALVLTRDFLEYEECDPGPKPRCSAKLAVGRLEEVPAVIDSCIGSRVDPKLFATGRMSVNGALKRVGEREFLAAWEEGPRLGGADLKWKRCSTAVSSDEAPPKVLFQISGKQLDGTTQEKLAEIDLARVVRIVTKTVDGD